MALLEQATPRELAAFEKLLRAEWEHDLRVRGTWYCGTPNCDGKPHPGWQWKHARRQQTPASSDDGLFLVFGGRGGGKTRAGAEWLADQIRRDYDRKDDLPGEWAMVGPVFAHARDIMAEGESGLLKALGWTSDTDPGFFVVAWNRSMGQIRLGNGDVVYCDGSAIGAVRIQGKNLRGAWCDEIRLWGRLAMFAWNESIEPALRKGRAQICATTTPSPTKLIKQLIQWAGGNIRRVTMKDNIENLSERRVHELIEKYKGTRTGATELDGILLEDIEGSLVKYDQIGRGEWRGRAWYTRIVVAVDPSDGNTTGDAQGIVCAGLGLDRRYHVLWAKAFRGSQSAMLRRAERVLTVYKADTLVIEKNHGGGALMELADKVIPNCARSYVNASDGKRVRATPVAWLYEQGKVDHIGVHEELEELWTTHTFQPKDKSPDLLDAAVWALTDLLQHATLHKYETKPDPGKLTEKQNKQQPDRSMTSDLLEVGF